MAIRRPRTRAQWASRIRAEHKETVGAFLKLGLTLIAAKKSLPHGEFLEMIEKDLPFTASTAQRLMKISADLRIAANAAHVQLLPSSWGTLYELTKVPDAAFAQAAESGAIHPQMTRRDATRLKLHVEHRPLRVTSVGYVGESKPLFSLPEAVDVPPLGLLEKLEKLEELAMDLSLSGGITAGGSVEKRIRAVANKLLSRFGQGTTLTH